MTSVKQPMITDAERERRARSIHSIRRSQQIEGGDISPFAQDLANEYIEGRMTTKEIRAQLAKHYKQLYGVNIPIEP